MRIFRLTPDREKYQGLVTDKTDELAKYDLFSGEHLSDKSLILNLGFDEQGDEKSLPRPDYPSLISYIPAFSKKALEALDPDLSSCGDLVKINSDGNYYALNITNIRDVLDQDKSSIKRFPSTGRIMDVPNYVLRIQDVSRMNDFFIFKMFGLTMLDIFVNESFKDRCEKAGLTGMLFTEVECIKSD